ncbi:MAG TPA: hypothetical protein VGG63_02885 [Steroidobacteraceae bacterium]
MSAGRSVRREPIDEHRAAARFAASEPDHLVLSNPKYEREQLLDFQFGSREARAISLVGVAQALTKL